MKPFFFLFLFLTNFIFAQNIHINHKNGIANEGYDVVSYFSGTPQKGSSKFTVKHHGVIYYFQNAQNKSKFQQNPERFLPQYGGYCAYAIGSSSEKVEVNPKTYKITEGKLYLFYNKYFNNTLTSWNEDERNLKVKADKNWKKLTSK
ncbi:YHS domain protein [compost metagenome]